MGSINTLLTNIRRLVSGGNNNMRYVPNAIQNDTPVGNSTRFPLSSTSMFICPMVSDTPGFQTEDDRKIVQRACKLMDQIVKSCSNSKLNLKNSPPFILDILPDTFTHLMKIFNQNENVLKDNEFLRVFLDNLINKCKDTIKLFKTNSIYNEQSLERRRLIKLSLTFSHMLFELKSQFPDGCSIGEKFRMTKHEAESFWQQKFPKKSMVPWSKFLTAMEEFHGQQIKGVQAGELKATIDLSGDDYVSTFEFDVFTRLFYPFKTIVKNWETLTTSHPGYCAFLTYDEVKKKLESSANKPGSYIFRLSCTRPGQWAIGYVAPDGKIYQTIPQNKSLIQALHEGNKEGFYIYPDGQQTDVNLTKLMEVPQADHVQVTSEQYELYCEMGTTFELCKICDDNEKNIKIEPCGHLLCSKCLANWQDSDGGGNTCPFCRYEIKGTNRVVIERFEPAPLTKIIEILPKLPPKSHVRKKQNSVSHSLPTVSELPINPPPLPPKSVNSKCRSSDNSIISDNLFYVNVDNLEESNRQSVFQMQVPLTNAPTLPAPIDNRAAQFHEYTNTIQRTD